MTTTGRSLLIALCTGLCAAGLGVAEQSWECGWVDSTNEKKYNIEALRDLDPLVFKKPADGGDPHSYTFTVSVCKNLATSCDLGGGITGKGLMHQDRDPGGPEPAGCMGWMGEWGADDRKLAYTALPNNKEGFMIETHSGSESGSCSEKRRKSQLVFECDESIEDSNIPMTIVEDEREDPDDPERRRMCMYTATIRTKRACAGSEGPGRNGGKPSGSLSGGWIFFMVVAIPFFVYCVAGCAFKFHKGERGKSMLPNHTFWTDLPSLVKDGAAFTKDKIMTLAGQKSTTEYSTMESSA